MTASVPALTAPGVELRDWGGALAVAYSHRSNSTHLVSAVAAELLRAAADGELTADLRSEHAEAIDMLLRFGLLAETP